MKIIFISAEMSPYAKTGGLGDVAGSLPEALNAQGVETIAIMPRYREIEQRLEYHTDLYVKMGDIMETCIIRTDPRAKVPTYFIDSHRFFDRDGIYGHYDDGERFLFFCKAILCFLKKEKIKTDIIHLNDWHTAPISLMLKTSYRDDEFFKDTKTVFSIHNLKYQGLFGKELLEKIDVSDEVFLPEGVEYYGSFNFMKTGIVFSDHITTVSKTYAAEILTEAYGEGMDGVLKTRKTELTGIVNGIDTNEFDPMDQDDMENVFSIDDLSGKKENKKLLLDELGLKGMDQPLLSVISRLDDQKGLYLILKVLEKHLEKGRDICFILLGVGDRFYEEGFTKLAEKYPENIAALIKFDLKMAKKIYSASDIFLMPSKFEPCGLGQLISMRYGTVPLVRETGGLKDTVIDFDVDDRNGNGFTFKELGIEDFEASLKRTLKHYKKASWKTVVKNAISTDNSWKRASLEYIELYKKVMGK